MAWIESHQSLATHRKTMHLEGLLRIKTPQAVGHLHLLWWWALDNAPHGELSNVPDQVLARAAQWPGNATAFVQALIDAGFIDSDSRRLHDWEDYSGRLVFKREANTARMRAARAQHVQRTTSAQPAHVQGLQDPTVPNSTQPTGPAAPPNPQPPKATAATATAEKSIEDVDTNHEQRPAATIKDSLGEIATIFEQNFGLLTPMTGELLQEYVTEYGPEWTRDALTRAVKAGKHRLDYVEGILKGWKANGRGPPGHGNDGHGNPGQKKDTLDEDLKLWTGR